MNGVIFYKKMVDNAYTCLPLRLLQTFDKYDLVDGWYHSVLISITRIQMYLLSSLKEAIQTEIACCVKVKTQKDASCQSTYV